MQAGRISLSFPTYTGSLFSFWHVAKYFVASVSCIMCNHRMKTVLDWQVFSSENVTRFITSDLGQVVEVENEETS